MQQLAVISDIHGNITGARAVLDALDSEGFTGKLVVAGDIVTGGSGESDLIQLLLDSDVTFIRGNMEDFLRAPDTRMGNIDKKNRVYVTEWYERLKAELSDNEWQMLVHSPLTRKYVVGNKKILICHASPADPWAWSCYSDAPNDVLYSAYGLERADIIVYGHFHKNHVMDYEGKVLVNAASVGLRHDGLSHYTVIEDIDDEVFIRQESVSYDVEIQDKLDAAADLPKFLK